MTASDYLVVERLEAKVEELRAEIERLHAEMDQRMAAYIEYQERDEAEIERLRAERLAFATESEERKAEIRWLRAVIGEWAQARAAMNGVKINTLECAEAFRRLGSAETALAALKTKP